jgi:protein-S-isoprenylcysteine O-methyltransferase Ste14
MIRRLVPPLLILPGTVLVLVPASIIWLTDGTRWEAQLVGFDDLRFWLAVLLTCAGLLLTIRTCQLFVTVGKGTPAPWDPPQMLVVQGPYRYVRNPMITSVLFLLAAEALFLASWVLAGWLLVVFLANAVYFPLVEEKALERRFGDHYRLYKANVPRWILRIRPWR